MNKRFVSNFIFAFVVLLILSVMHISVFSFLSEADSDHKNGRSYSFPYDQMTNVYDGYYRFDSSIGKTVDDVRALTADNARVYKKLFVESETTYELESTKALPADYYAQASERINKYLTILGVDGRYDEKNGRRENYKCYFDGEIASENAGQTEKYTVYSGEDSLCVVLLDRVVSDVAETTVYNILSDRFVKAAVEMSGASDKKMTTETEYDVSGIKEITVRLPDSKSDTGCFSMDKMTVTIGRSSATFIKINFEDDNERISTRRMIGVDEALKRLRNGDYYCFRPYGFNEKIDLSGSEYAIEYTDKISKEFILPCYRIAVKTDKYNERLELTDGDHVYSYLYVPAVDMNENPETGEVDPVAAAVCAVASAVLLAAVQISLKKIRKSV